MAAVFDRLRKSIRHLSIKSASSTLGENYRAYGARMGIPDFDSFITRAEDLLEKALDAVEAGNNPAYKTVALGHGRIGVDYNNGEERGIYNGKGTPLSYYSPKLREDLTPQMREEEVADFLGLSLPRRSRTL